MDGPANTRRIRPPLTVLVTGATGFLGSYIVDSYVRRGFQVRALARQSSDLTWLQHHLQSGAATLTLGSMTDADSLKRAVHGVDWVVHVAAVIGPNIPHHVYQAVNVAGTQTLIDYAVAAEVSRFTLISSVSTYGNGITPGGIVTEETPQQPSNPYGVSKLAQQEIVFAAHREHGLPVVSLEPPVIYGPRARVGIGQAFNLVKRRIAPLLAGGSGRMNLVHVADVVGLLEAADADDTAIGERFLAAGPRFVGHREILRLIAISLGVKPLYIPIPLWITVGAITLYNAGLTIAGRDTFLPRDYFYRFTKGADYRTDKAQRLLNWTPTIDVTTGIPETVAWFVAQGM